MLLCWPSFFFTNNILSAYRSYVSNVSCTICIIGCLVVPRFSPQIIYFSADRSYASYQCIICNKCICVFPQICDQLSCEYVSCVSYVFPYVSYVTNVCVSPHLSQKCDQLSCEYVSCVSYHVPYVSYVTNVFVYSHICLGICPQNVTNFCGCVLHASVVATVVRIPRSEVTLHVIGREAGCGWSPRFV